MREVHDFFFACVVQRLDTISRETSKLIELNYFLDKIFFGTRPNNANKNQDNLFLINLFISGGLQNFLLNKSVQKKVMFIKLELKKIDLYLNILQM